ncbi:MAG: ABC transporter substrate-binding protein, partial [Myxococcales bacterium]|nr:ABC transporter substrate-binding protein [Myxococcales bacterium]
PAHPIVGELAERWDVSDDKRVYTFHLHEGVTWHDGKPFGSKDVVATFDKILDEDTLSVHTRSYFELLDKHEAVDAHTVRFTWKKPYFMTLDAFEMVPIMPAHVLEKMSATEFNEAATNPLNRRPVGTGPFKFVEWEASQKIVLARNDAYWGKKAHLDRVVFRIVRDDTVRKQMAQRLDVDVWTRPSDDDWVKMKDERVFVEKFNRSLIYDHSYAWIGWNQAAKPFFADKRVRRALGQLVNRKRIAETMFFGLRKPTECHFYWASRECEGLEQFPYDRKAAEQLLTEAGWVDSDGDGIRDKDGVPFRFTFMVPASSVNSAKMGTKMKEDYHRAGIEMDIQKVEWTVFTKRLRKHEFDACTLMWGSSGPRADPVQIWHSNALEGGSNYISFRSDRADQLIEQAAVEFDVDKRTELYREFGRLLKDEQPYTMLFVSPRKALLHKRIRGARESLMWWRFRDWWVDGER